MILYDICMESDECCNRFSSKKHQLTRIIRTLLHQIVKLKVRRFVFNYAIPNSCIH